MVKPLWHCRAIGNQWQETVTVRSQLWILALTKLALKLFKPYLFRGFQKLVLGPHIRVCVDLPLEVVPILEVFRSQVNLDLFEEAHFSDKNGLSHN